jgi:DNA-binding XRE family transcriptional regulator
MPTLPTTVPNFPGGCFGESVRVGSEGEDVSAEHFPGRLKELRWQKGLTQQQFADAARVAKATVADLEQGRYAPSWPTVVALAGALGVDCLAFLQELVERPGTDRGRPPKHAAEPESEPAPKRPRGRPRKGE